MNFWLAQVIGYSYAVVVGGVLTYWVVRQLWLSTGTEDSPALWRSSVLGCVERSLFVASWQIGAPEFIGLWLGLKVVVQWGRWTDSPKNGGIERGRTIYMNFLIGSGLSIAFGIVGAMMTEWLKEPEGIVFGIVVPLSLVLANLILLVWVWTKTPPKSE